MTGPRARIEKCCPKPKEQLPALQNKVNVLVEKFCGVDVHRDLLVATILSGETYEKQTRRFQNDLTT